MTTHAAIGTHDEDAAAASSNMLLAVRLAILSEVMLFGALFAAYFVIRGESPGWPPGHNERPELVLPAFNTLLLVTSSVTMQLAVRSARAGTRSRILRWLGLTLLLGGVFIVIQAYEFSTNGFGLSAGTFGSTFYILTGFHGAHVLAGAILIAIVSNRTRLGLLGEHHTALEGISYYWHFVDVVWIFLFATLYVL